VHTATLSNKEKFEKLKTLSENQRPCLGDQIFWKIHLIACMSTCDATCIPGEQQNPLRYICGGEKLR
jgi:hypothetical protein